MAIPHRSFLPASLRGVRAPQRCDFSILPCYLQLRRLVEAGNVRLKNHVLVGKRLVLRFVTLELLVQGRFGCPRQGGVLQEEHADNHAIFY